MSFSFIEFILVSGSIHSILFTFFLLAKSKKEFFSQNLFLSLYIISFSIVVLKGWYNGSGYYLLNPEFLFFPVYFTWGIGPIFYFYISFSLVKDFSFNKKQWIHLLPAFIQFLYHLTIFFKPSTERISHFQNEYLYIFLPIEDIFGILSLGIYFFLSLQRVKKYQKSVYNNYTDVRRVLLRWINRFIYAGYFFLLSWVTLFAIDYFIYNYQQNYSFYYPVYILIVVISYWVIYEGFFSPFKVEPGFVFSNGSPQTYSLPEKEIRQFLEKLSIKMEKEELYLNPKLSLQILANSIDINPKYLSQIINSHLNKSFYDFVNEYRVNKAKKELLSTQNSLLTISAISSLCGFNSKSTFNEVFKKLTSQTPSSFVKKNT